MIQIYGTSTSIMLDVDRYEYDSDPKIIENESYNGHIYRTRHKERKRWNFSAVVDDGDRQTLESLEGESTTTMYDEDGTEYTGFIINLRFERIAGADFYRATFTYRGWEA